MDTILVLVGYGLVLILWITAIYAYNKDVDDLRESLGSLARRLLELGAKNNGIITPALSSLVDQVDHLATVQMLMLKDMGKEYQVQPEKDVLVTVGNLSDLKKSKERSA